MNKIKEKILRESYGYKGSYFTEDYVLSNFVKAFVEDYKEFGEDTANLYKTMFMLDEDVRMDLLQENIEYVTEMVESSGNNLLFESVLRHSLNEETAAEFYKKKLEAALSMGLSKSQAEATAMRAASAKFPDMIKSSAERITRNSSNLAGRMENTTGGSTPQVGYTSTEQMDLVQDTGMKSGLAKTLDIEPKGFKTTAAFEKLDPTKTIGNGINVTPNAMVAQTNAILDAPNPEAALAAASLAPTGDAIGGAAEVAGAGGILGMIKKAFNAVKGFFTGGVKSIGTAVKAGNWGALLAIPLVKAALITGGAVLAFKILKKLFGNRIKSNQEASLKSRLLAAQGR